MEQQKPSLEAVPIWRCKDKECKAWVRAELASSATPSCPLCAGPMAKSMKHLPKLVNKFKRPPKQTQS